jgi:cellulose synthase operon protein C
MKMVNVRSIRAIFFSLVLLLSLSQTGCSVFDTVGGWISHGYDNTVSYFNAYYNAKTLFDDAEAEVLAARSAMKSKTATPFAAGPNLPGSSQYAGAPGSPGYPGAQGFPSNAGMQSSPGFPSATPQQTYQSSLPQQTSSTSKQKFAAVIDKCSHILSFYPNSSVVDDALFLIGKSYFYQDEFVKAERKFSELIVQDPNGSLSLSAQLWLLKTLQRLGRFDDANRVGNALADAATKAEKTEIAGEALDILGDVAVAEKKRDAALEMFARGVADADNGPIRATAQARIGDIYSSSEEYEKAALAYEEVAKYSPDAYGYYSSQVQAAVAYRRIGKFQVTIDILRKLEADYRFMDFWGTIRFELASTYAADHKLDEAIDLYRLVDTTNARTEQGARAAFELGKLLQFQVRDYANARIAYSHASVGGAQDLTQEAQRRATALEKYFRLSDQFMKLDSIYFIIDIDSMWTKSDSTALAAKKGVSDSLAVDASDKLRPPDEFLGRRRTKAPVVPDSSLLTSKKTVPDSLVGVTKKDTLRADADSVGRLQMKTALRPVADTTSSKKSADLDDRPAGPSPRIVSKPRKDTLVASLGNISYQLGELFYTDLDVPDSTFIWLNQGLKLGLDSIKSVRALFVLAEVMRANPAKMYGDEKELYRQIIDKYPKSSYAEEARLALGFPPTPKKEDPATAVFAVAESLMYAGKYQSALDSLGRIVKDYPESPMTPKSRYTMAWIYEHHLANPDSAIAQYKTIAAKHSNTKYGEAALRRIPPPVVDTVKKVIADTVKKAPTDTTKKAGIGLPQKAAVDSTTKPQSAGAPKMAPDTTMKFPQKPPLPVDSLSKKVEIEEKILRRTEPKDSAAVRRIEK